MYNTTEMRKALAEKVRHLTEKTGTVCAEMNLENGEYEFVAEYDATDPDDIKTEIRELLIDGSFCLDKEVEQFDDDFSCAIFDHFDTAVPAQKLLKNCFNIMGL